MIRIDSYSPGRMSVAGRIHQRDLKIIDERVVADWWRREGHRLEADDVRDILAAAPALLVVGMGYDSHMRIDERLRRRLDHAGIALVAQDTARAVDTFNRLRAEGRRAAGAFHLTC